MYDELIKNLRGRSQFLLPHYGEETSYDSDLMKQAADAIEELVRKEKFHAFLWNTIQPNEMEQYLSMYRAQAVPSEPPKEE